MNAVERAVYRYMPVVAQVVDDGKGGERGRFVLLGEWEAEVPISVIMIYPLIFFSVITFLWCVFFRGYPRTGLTWKLFFESALCFPCLWAELSTKFKLLTSCRAWFYIVMLAGLLVTFNFFTFWAPEDDVPMQYKERMRLLFFIGVPSILFLWVAFAVERACVRKAIRRAADPLAETYLLADFLSSLLCAPCAALQEAEFMAYVEPPSKDDVVSESLLFVDRVVEVREKVPPRQW